MNYLGEKEPDSTESEFLEPVIYHMRHWHTMWQDHLNVDMTVLNCLHRLTGAYQEWP